MFRLGQRQMDQKGSMASWKLFLCRQEENVMQCCATGHGLCFVLCRKLIEVI